MKTLRDEVARILPEAIEMRRYLHSHPELSGQEFQTRAYICQKLESWGIPYRCCEKNTGVIADIGRGSGSFRLPAPVRPQHGSGFQARDPELPADHHRRPVRGRL